MMSRRARVATLRLGEEALDVLADALSYYLSCTEMGGPDDHPPARIRRVQGAVLRARLKLDGVR